jgi:hypothetical protein
MGHRFVAHLENSLHALLEVGVGMAGSEGFRGIDVAPRDALAQGDTFRCGIDRGIRAMPVGGENSQISHA